MDNMVAIVELRQGHRIAVSGSVDDVMATALAVKERDELRHLCARLCRERDEMNGARNALRNQLRALLQAGPCDLCYDDRCDPVTCGCKCHEADEKCREGARIAVLAAAGV